MANQGLVRDSLLKMECHPGGDDCILRCGGSSKVYHTNESKGNSEVNDLQKS